MHVEEPVHPYSAHAQVYMRHAIDGNDAPLSYPNVIAMNISADGITLRIVPENICHNATLGYLRIPPPTEVYLVTTLIHLSCMATLYYIELIRYQ